MSEIADGVREPRALCLYGIIPGSKVGPWLAESGLQAVLHADLCAVVEPATPEAVQLQGEGVVDDLSAVAALAARHIAVLEHVMQFGAVVPTRIGAVFSSSAAVAETLASQECRFRDLLERFEGHEEWAVHLQVDRRRLEAQVGTHDAELERLAAAAAAAGPGMAYLHARLHDARVEVLVNDRIDHASDGVFDRVEGLASEVVLLPCRAGPPDGPTAVMSSALLVATTAREPFCEQLRVVALELEGEGFVLEWTGPWPAYSFCNDLSDDGEAT
jgi:hypothetical protein